MIRLTGGEWNRRQLTAPPGRKTRPTTARVRQSVMAKLTSHLPGARILDVFAGSGAMSFEALSRGATYALLFERDRHASRLIEENARRLALDANRLKVRTGDALRLLRESAAAPFDILYLDPPYGYEHWQETLGLLVEYAWLVPGGLTLAERRRRDPAPTAEGWQESQAWIYGDTVVSVLECAATSPIMAMPFLLGEADSDEHNSPC
ncbi:MAG: 16S rRNA (guanine(966)-N(2))-methyltransferase RsmD [Vampirovibrionales bacterium]|nr:16S rRNA (guanine(966)-N(2))-methyltransferase RsmD [Vampirovibrionales bacterium]